MCAKKEKMRTLLAELLEIPATENALDVAKKAGVKGQPSNMAAVSAALLLEALRGNVKAIKLINEITGDDEYLRLQRERLALEKRKAFPPIEKPQTYHGIPASLIAPTFSSIHFDIEENGHMEYVLPGGRGSTKSSFFALEVVDIIMRSTDIHACVLRQIGNTIKDSVYSKIKWAIGALGIDSEFKYTTSPFEITRVSTGQKIYFRGADDPDKIKSISPEFGYIGVVWFEELDQFHGEDAVRKIEQSVIRGGDTAYKFKSFNPPKSANNWANKYIKIPRDDRLVVMSTYHTVPQKWLGKPFLDDAEFLKKTNPAAYENEYDGIANGSGGAVFDNVTARQITDEEISHFDRIYHGVDWGWYPDPYAYNRMHYDKARHALYIYGEYHANKKSNEETAKTLFELGVSDADIITCDSAEQKSVGDYRAYGLSARPAIKGPGSVEYSMKWMQSLHEIVIDPIRCPETAKEFLNYEYERDKNGEIITGYPDENNHHIDAVRYAMETVWRRKGE